MTTAYALMDRTDRIKERIDIFRSRKNSIRPKRIDSHQISEQRLLDAIFVNNIKIVASSNEYFLPVKLKKVASQIEKSRYIYSLENNWDEENSKGYLIETWERMVEYLVYYAKKLDIEMDSIINEPNILPGEGGEIEVIFKSKTFSMLINFPEEREENPYYNCISIENPNKLNYSGEFCMGQNDDLILTLLNNFSE